MYGKVYKHKGLYGKVYKHKGLYGKVYKHKGLYGKVYKHKGLYGKVYKHKGLYGKVYKHKDISIVPNLIAALTDRYIKYIVFTASFRKYTVEVISLCFAYSIKTKV